MCHNGQGFLKAFLKPVGCKPSDVKIFDDGLKHVAPHCLSLLSPEFKRGSEDFFRNLSIKEGYLWVDCGKGVETYGLHGLKCSLFDLMLHDCTLK